MPPLQTDTETDDRSASFRRRKKRHQPICARVSIVDVHHKLVFWQKSACLDRIEPGNSTLLIASKPACSSAFIAPLLMPTHTIVPTIVVSHFKYFMAIATPKRLLYHPATMPTDLAHNTDRSSKTTWMIACEDTHSSLGRGHSKANENPSQSAPSSSPSARRISRRLVSHRLNPYRLVKRINHLKSLASLTRSHSRWIAVFVLLIIGQHLNAELAGQTRLCTRR